MKKYNFKFASGFTLPELIITMSVFVTLISLATISLVNVRKESSLSTTIDVLIGDMRQQQLKAMIGDTEHTGTQDAYGVYLSEFTYILFKGSSYDPGSSSNFSIPYGGSIEAENPGATVIYARRSGDLTGGATSITLIDTASGKEQSISINAYGVVTAVN